MKTEIQRLQSAAASTNSMLFSTSAKEASLEKRMLQYAACTHYINGNYVFLSVIKDVRWVFVYMNMIRAFKMNVPHARDIDATSNTKSAGMNHATKQVISLVTLLALQAYCDIKKNAPGLKQTKIFSAGAEKIGGVSSAEARKQSRKARRSISVVPKKHPSTGHSTGTADAYDSVESERMSSDDESDNEGISRTHHECLNLVLFALLSPKMKQMQKITGVSTTRSMSYHQNATNLLAATLKFQPSLSSPPASPTAYSDASKAEKNLPQHPLYQDFVDSCGPAREKMHRYRAEKWIDYRSGDHSAEMRLLSAVMLDCIFPVQCFTHFIVPTVRQLYAEFRAEEQRVMTETSHYVESFLFTADSTAEFSVVSDASSAMSRLFSDFILSPQGGGGQLTIQSFHHVIDKFFGPSPDQMDQHDWKPHWVHPSYLQRLKLSASATTHCSGSSGSGTMINYKDLFLSPPGCSGASRTIQTSPLTTIFFETLLDTLTTQVIDYHDGLVVYVIEPAFLMLERDEEAADASLSLKSLEVYGRKVTDTMTALWLKYDCNSHNEAACARLTGGQSHQSGENILNSTTNSEIGYYFHVDVLNSMIEYVIQKNYSLLNEHEIKNQRKNSPKATKRRVQDIINAATCSAYIRRVHGTPLVRQGPPKFPLHGYQSVSSTANSVPESGFCSDAGGDLSTNMQDGSPLTHGESGGAVSLLPAFPMHSLCTAEREYQQAKKVLVESMARSSSRRGRCGRSQIGRSSRHSSNTRKEGPCNDDVVHSLIASWSHRQESTPRSLQLMLSALS